MLCYFLDLEMLMTDRLAFLKILLKKIAEFQDPFLVLHFTIVARLFAAVNCEQLFLQKNYTACLR